MTVRELRLPVRGRPKVLLLGAEYRGKGHVQSVPASGVASLSTTDAEVVGVRGPLLRGLAPGAFASLAVLLALHRPGEMLTAEDRAALWRKFEVPVYERWICGDGRVVAAECEAHEGLHVCCEGFAFVDGQLVLSTASGSEATGLTGRFEDGLCACGRDGGRLLDLAPLRRALAARL